MINSGQIELTYEEAACLALGYSYDLWVSMHSKDQSSLIYIEVTNWCKGAKWQAKRMCSEEEVKELIEKLVKDCYYMQEPNQDVAKWFEQFKKK